MSRVRGNGSVTLPLLLDMLDLLLQRLPLPDLLLERLVLCAEQSLGPSKLGLIPLQPPLGHHPLVRPRPRLRPAALPRPPALPRSALLPAGMAAPLSLPTGRTSHDLPAPTPLHNTALVVPLPMMVAATTPAPPLLSGMGLGNRPGLCSRRRPRVCRL